MPAIAVANPIVNASSGFPSSIKSSVIPRIAFMPSFSAVTMGDSSSPKRPVFSSSLALASLASQMAALFSRQPAAAFINPCSASSCNTRFARSLSVPAAARRSLNASSLVPAQFRTSAKVPVTFPTLTVSLMASARPSMGMLSPYVAHAPIAPSVSCFNCCWDTPSACKFAVAVAACWVSPKTPYSCR